jgi:type I restriction enzyme, S subunit
MNTYSLVSVRDIVTIHYGKALKTEDRIESGSIPVFGANGQIGFHNVSLIDFPTLVIGRKGSAGEVTYTDCGGWIIDTAFYTEITKPDRVDIRYLFYALKRANLENLTITTSIPGVNRDSLYSKKIPLPPLEEQKRIAAILDKADDIRRKRKEAIALTDELLRSTFLDMFGDPVTNPKGWKIYNLSDVCKKITDGTHHSPPIVSKGIPYITAKHLKKHGLDFYLDPWFIANEDHARIYSRCNPEKGDVLYIKDGATTGIAAINNYDFEFSMLSSLALLKVGKTLTSEYLCDWLNSENVKEKHLTKLAGAAITRLTLKKIKDFHIPVPPLDIQKKYREFRQQITKLESALNTDKKNSEYLFNSLLQKAFRGEL